MIDYRLIILAIILIGAFFIVSESVMSGEVPIELDNQSISFIAVALLAIVGIGFIVVWANVWA